MTDTLTFPETSVEGDIALKGGYSTADPRLDRIPVYDERSRKFNVAPLVSDAPLRSRSHPSKVWMNQGREGACVSFSFHSEAGASPKPVKGLTFDIARDRYWEMQRQDEWPGGSYPGANPRYEGTSVLAGAKVMQSLGFFSEYRWAFNIDDCLKALANEGPVVFGIPWLNSMFRTREDGTMDTSGRQAGGHAIMGRGVTVPRQGTATITFPSGRVVKLKTSEPVVRLRNTWVDGPNGQGGNWGIDGECLLLASQVEQLAFRSGWGEVCIPIGRKIP